MHSAMHSVMHLGLMASHCLSGVCRALRDSLTDNEGKGFIKVVVDAKTDKVLGIHLVGPEVAEILQVLFFLPCLLPCVLPRMLPCLLPCFFPCLLPCLFCPLNVPQTFIARALAFQYLCQRPSDLHLAEG